VTLQLALIISTAILSLLLAVSVYFNVKHGLIIVKFLEAIEESLDVMDERYSSINKVLETPLFYDSPQIRQVLDDVRICRDSILLAANILTENNVVEEED
tara:strand:+ start:232 stop:531 length:300 start_codon:yes stop_codon:yes gene_type:complete